GPSKYKLRQGLEANGKVLPLGKRILGIENGDGNLRDAKTVVGYFGDDFRRHFHAAGTNIDVFGDLPAERAEAGLAVAYRDTEKRVRAKIGNPVRCPPGQRHPMRIDKARPDHKICFARKDWCDYR